MSTSRRSVGLWSDSELFALKKNQAEDTRLKEKIGCMSMNNAILKQTMDRDKRSLQLFLKDIRMNTGHSKEAAPPRNSERSEKVAPQNKTNSSYSHLSTISYEVPEKLIQRSAKSYDLRPRNSLLAEIDEVIKDDSFTKTSFLNISKGNGLYRRRAVTTSELDNEPDSKSKLSARLMSDTVCSKPFLLRVKQPNVEQKKKDDSSVFLDVDNNDDDKICKKDENEKEDDDDKQFAFLNRIYNPWNIQHRNGLLYNALALPEIRDCYRPACRPSCYTCMTRKQKIPCFVVPGITHPSDFVLPKLLTSKKYRKPKIKKKSKGKSSSQNSLMKIEQVECNEFVQSDSPMATKTTAHGAVSDFVINVPLLADPTHTTYDEDTGKPFEDKSVLEKLKFVVPNESKSINKTRLEELSRPKDGFKKDIRYSKIFIKREVERMTKIDTMQKLSDAEKQNRRRIESRISTFLALLNMEENPCVPVKMVHIPLRDDVMHVDISHHAESEYGNETFTIQKIMSSKRKVYFLMKMSADQVC